jgi:CheY-like chemotaxis protein
MDFDQLANEESLQKTVSALGKRGYDVAVVPNGQEALEQIKKLISPGASVMNGSSVTLEQIGYQEYLASGKHGWVDLHALVTRENDKEKRAKLRRELVLSDFYLGSVHALEETGEFVIASNTGSQLPHVVFTSPNIVFVVSTKKIVPDREAAMKRLEEHVFPLEDKHMMEKYQAHTGLNKIVIFRGESPVIGRKVRFILVKENLGF